MIGNESPILRNLDYIACPELIYGQDDNLEGFSLDDSTHSTRAKESDDYCEDVPVIREKTAAKKYRK